ncbi:MAG TPA: sulfotransferase, partial [Acidimicrobiia bacterium]|nr:sulfotransferase [Acidimicrobiia bacterium]
GYALDAASEARMREFLVDNAQDKHGSHTYTWADTGLDMGAVRERAKKYQDYFDVTSESFA